MEYTICTVTAKSDIRDTLLCKSINELGLECDFNFITDNSEHLCKCYNKFLDEAKKDNVDGILFVHDDVILECDPFVKLEKLFCDYDVIGVAGASRVEFNSPALWHLMGGGFGSGFLHGAVAHGDFDRKMMTSFGPYPKRVIMIDGVFMALNKHAIQNSKGFDENIPSKFHFYDLDFSTSCHMNGMKVGVGDIPITHASPGLREFTDDWRAGEKYFLEKYGQ